MRSRVPKMNQLIIFTSIAIFYAAGVSGYSDANHNYVGSKRKYCPAEEFLEEQPAVRVDTSQRLKALRSEMKRISTLQTAPLDAYIITSDDEHQNVHVTPRDARLAFITGYTGSAGIALVTDVVAFLWTDGDPRADLQLDCNWRLMTKNCPTIIDWLMHRSHGRKLRIGADPKLIPAVLWNTWEERILNSSTKLIAVENNLIDKIWQISRPEYTRYEAYPLDETQSGLSWQEKIKQVRDAMLQQKAAALVVTALDEIGWLFNIRGYDLPHAPLLKAYAIIEQSKIRLYTLRHKLHRSTQIHLKMDDCNNPDCVTWRAYTKIFDDLKTLSQIWNMVWLPTSCGYTSGVSKMVYLSIPAKKRLARPSPIINLKAVKNKIEIAGMRNAHAKDAVAMCDFFAYMDEQINLGATGWDEQQVARVANEYRYEQNESMGTSFPTIVGYGSHGALPHNVPSNLTSFNIGRDSMLVIDSGGQYRDGTTDVTRTLHFGVPSQEQKEAYTRVLIGHIEFASAIFPSQTSTNQLDLFARKILWQEGYDYHHRTGHGIGHFSLVHESPIDVHYQSSRIPDTDDGCNTQQLKPGNFLSNEPGYYKNDDFGVRIGNIVEVVPAELSTTCCQHYLKFQDATLIPYEPKLYVMEMLSSSHRRWLNNYNRRVRENIGFMLKKDLRMQGFRWMMNKTEYIPEKDETERDFFFEQLFAAKSASACTTIDKIFVIISYLINSQYRFLNN